MSHRVEIDMDRGPDRPIYRLLDDATGASASILPWYGFNLFDLRLPAAGEVRRVIVSADDFADRPEKPGRNGVPILFPFPNRIRDGRYSFGGVDYRLPIPPGKEHAIHGFAIDARWDVVDHGATEAEAFVVGRFQISRNAPEMLPRWPSDAVITVKHALAGRRWSMEIEVENPTDSSRLPYGFGIHPYFRLPFAADDPGQGRLVLPASESWVLEGSLPTGERRPVDPRLDFRRGASTEGRDLDDVLTGLHFVDGHCTCRLRDVRLGVDTVLRFDESFRDLVVFVPPHSDTLVAVEPYTQVTDAINLQSPDLDAGLRVLGPGESARMVIEVHTEG